ncbi:MULTISPECIES: small, acid-soluble spore protein, alpha/beta type [Bacillus cereus group]|uniref:small, acid-soluble spore protein, alpha/beta type n=1 Tax=Bacillus cereus group TaxID=86661 RepID=UPI001F37BA9D|nr:small, acid-soluble spore protein, alpha/beta type [Bacillus cereus]MDA1521241.1 small, acid-soluble spore protein, alpha/beta type [Bacillus cereus]HDR7981614.1 small, acid-soluble spore protein, alpha/beta type [Bacillus cereus]HDR8059629.1 small, acid-soluble spore protein, alpha/beta type [Bacillus cereus]HDR8220231.1 small, acid-soluble spore protein, alpha/beta type [Bacillus cereus]HDR8229393.1 small, acid-soluble spore protein, alpha/beta type [Bacillus cereus]
MNITNEVLISAAAIARELGVTLGPDTSARANGPAGEEITKSLVRMAEEQLTGQYRLH